MDCPLRIVGGWESVMLGGCFVYLPEGGKEFFLIEAPNKKEARTIADEFYSPGGRLFEEVVEEPTHLEPVPQLKLELGPAEVLAIGPSPERGIPFLVEDGDDGGSHFGLF